MEFITKIQIRKFRSIKTITRDLKPSHLNIFVGQNDQGKSNILRALNLFFNGYTDSHSPFNFLDEYCFNANTGKGSRVQIRIDLFIQPPKDRFTRPDPVKWTKIWKKDGSVLEDRTNLKKGKPLSQTNNVYKWLDKIRYRYVPAIKSNEYFRLLMGELHDVLNESHADILGEQGQQFIKGIQEVTNNITEVLDSQIGIRNSIQVPSDFRLLFSNLDFGIKKNDSTYHLKQRGDGIKVRHIPIILKYMSDKEKSVSIPGFVKPDTIWGFEEPENNLEMKYAYDLAKTMKEYSKDIQIFLTTHSPAFYALDESDTDGVKTFFIEKDKNECTDLRLVEHADAEELHEKMGVLHLITPYLQEIMERQREIEKLKDGVKDFSEGTNVVILTEDSNTSLIEMFFEAQGCDLSSTEFVSYNGCANFSGALSVADYIKSKKDDVLIIIHRDRDYLNDNRINELKSKVEKKGYKFYCTSGVDIENEFINSIHINELYPELEIERIDELISIATEKSEEDSIKRLVDQCFLEERPKGAAYYSKFKELKELYESDKCRYRYGKKVASRLMGLLQEERKENSNIYKITDYIQKDKLLDLFN